MNLSVNLSYGIKMPQFYIIDELVELKNFLNLSAMNFKQKISSINTKLMGFVQS